MQFHKIKLDIRKGHSLVMLSVAKHLVTQRDRPFAEFTLSVANVLRMTRESRFQNPAYFVNHHYRARCRFISPRWAFRK